MRTVRPQLPNREPEALQNRSKKHSNNTAITQSQETNRVNPAKALRSNAERFFVDKKPRCLGLGTEAYFNLPPLSVIPLIL